MIPPFKVMVTSDTSRELQEAMLLRGACWSGRGADVVKNLNFPFLSYTPDDGILALSTRDQFLNNINPEFSFNQIYNRVISIPVPERGPDIPAFKIRVNPVQNRNIQDSLFRLGKTWSGGSQIFHNIDAPYLFFDRDEGEEGHLSYSRSLDVFERHEAPEYTYARLDSILQGLVANIPQVEERESGPQVVMGHHHVLQHGVNQAFGVLKVDSYKDDWSGTDRLIDQLNGLLGLNNI